MTLKNKILVIFLFCFIFMNSWCEEDTIIIGGYTYPASVRTTERFIIAHKAVESLDGIEQLEKLKELSIYDNAVPLRDISAIGKLTELTELAIASEGGEFRVRDIIGASKLRLLFIRNYETFDFEGIENFPELEDISIDSSIPINYESLTKLKKLKRLSFLVPEQNTNLQFIANMPNLEILVLKTDNKDYADPTITYIDIDVGFLRGLRNLEEITLWGFRIKNLNLLSELPELYYVTIRSSITDNADYSLFDDNDISILDDDRYKNR